MSAFRLIIAAFLHHWRMNLAVAAGAAVGTAVLAGALLVGDSMRGSLRNLALDRLGNIDEALIADRFFRVQLADELSQQDDAGKSDVGRRAGHHPFGEHGKSRHPAGRFGQIAYNLSAAISGFGNWAQV